MNFPAVMPTTNTADSWSQLALDISTIFGGLEIRPGNFLKL